MNEVKRIQHFFVLLVSVWFRTISRNSKDDHSYFTKMKRSELFLKSLEKTQSYPFVDTKNTTFVSRIFSFFGLSNLLPCCKRWIVELLLKRECIYSENPMQLSPCEVNPCFKKILEDMRLNRLCQRNLKKANQLELYVALLTTWILKKNETSRHLIIPEDFKFSMVPNHYPEFFDNTMYECFTNIEDNLEIINKSSFTDERFISNWIQKTEINCIQTGEAGDFMVESRYLRHIVSKKPKLFPYIPKHRSFYGKTCCSSEESKIENVIMGEDFSKFDCKKRFSNLTTYEIQYNPTILSANFFPLEFFNSDIFLDCYDESSKKIHEGYDSGYECGEHELFCSNKYVTDSNGKTSDFEEGIKTAFNIVIPDPPKNDKLPQDLPPWLLSCGCDSEVCNGHSDAGSIQMMNEGIKSSTCRQINLDIVCCLCKTPIFKARELSTRIGLLLGCEHSFCISCIKVLGRRELNCPECNASSPGVVPSSRWIGNGYEKTYLFKCYFSFQEELLLSRF